MVTGSQNRKGAISAPGRHYLQNCKQASLLTKTSWGSGQLSAWEGAPVVYPENQAGGTGQAISRSDRAHQTPHHRAAQSWEGHKTQAQQSLHLWGLPECLDLSGLDLGGSCSPGLASNGSLRSNLEPELCGQGGCMHIAAETLWAHASVICLQCPSLPTVRLNKWA